MTATTRTKTKAGHILPIMKHVDAYAKEHPEKNGAARNVKNSAQPQKVLSPNTHKPDAQLDDRIELAVRRLIEKDPEIRAMFNELTGEDTILSPSSQEMPQTFRSSGLGEIRVINRSGEPWFVAADVSRILGIHNARQTVSYLDDDEKGVISNDTLGGKQKTNIINESGLYSLILRSRKPQAKAFKRWITHDVIPSIRKTGKYATPTAETQKDEIRQTIQRLILAGEIPPPPVNPNEPLTLRLWDTDIRVFIRDGQAWFVATDLAAAAGIPFLTDALRYITDTEKVPCPCGTILSELGTYELLVRSKRINAAPLRRWIAHTVIPQIRTLGRTSSSPQLPATTGQTDAETELRIKERELQLKDETINILQQCLMQACKSS